jgi:hypothetical protein
VNSGTRHRSNKEPIVHCKVLIQRELASGELKRSAVKIADRVPRPDIPEEEERGTIVFHGNPQVGALATCILTIKIPNNHIGFRIGYQAVANMREDARLKPIVCIQICNDLPTAASERLVHGVTLALIRFRYPVQMRISLQDANAFILRATIYNDVLEISILLDENALNSTFKVTTGVKARRENTNLH